MNYWTNIVVAPAESPQLAGAINRRLFSAVPLPPGTRLRLGNQNFCTNGDTEIFEATVIRGAE